MGLSDLVARAASRQAHALLVEVPGWWRTRAVTERAILTRGWSLAFSPADADVLVVCGAQGPQLAEAVELIWQQLPGPRVRVDIQGYDDVTFCLDEAHAGLLDTERHRHDAHHRPQAAEALAAVSEDSKVDEGMDHGGHGGMDHGQHGGHGGQEPTDHGGHTGHGGYRHGRRQEEGGHREPDAVDHSAHGHHRGQEATDHSSRSGHDAMNSGVHGGHEAMEHSSHGGHQGMTHGNGGHERHEGMNHGGHDDHGGHGDMDMSPGGIPLAGGGEDRDGLEMDVLTVRLGPVLPHWPAGLVLHCSLQGDVITTVHAELLDDAQQAVTEAATRARRLDNVVSVLALAGWGDAAAHGRRLRDAALEHGWNDVMDTELVRFRARVRRSRLLRWSLRGVAPLGVEEVHHHGLPPDVIGDSYDRLIRMLDLVAPGAEGDQERVYVVEHLAHAVTGLDLATARLAIASLGVRDVRTGQTQHEVSHG